MILGFILMVLVLGFGLIISLTKFVFGAVFGVIGAIVGAVVLVIVGLNLMFAFIPIAVIIFLILCCRKLIK
jgi:hypothetical protein